MGKTRSKYYIMFYDYRTGYLIKMETDQSVRSRAARRQASPSLDVDKSLTSLPRAEESSVQRESVLTDRRNSGIMKKQKAKALSRAQKQRQQKGIERAEAVMDQLEIKVSRSTNRAKTIKARRVCALFFLVWIGRVGG